MRWRMDKANKKITHTRQIDAAKPKDARYALTVGDGLSLYVMPKGTKKWVFRYSMFGKPKSLSLGLYPAVGLSEAKELRDQQRKLVAQGVDPSSRRKENKLEKLLSDKNSFEAIANEWLERQTDKEDSTRSKAKWLLSTPIADFGSTPIKEITPIMVLQTCRRYETKGNYETAKRILSKCSQVFRYAVSTVRLDSDPTRDLRGALKSPQVKHRSAITDPEKVGTFLNAMDTYSGTSIVRAALRLAPLVFVRPGELRSARWEDIDLEQGEWRFTPPKTRNQTRVDLIVPLATQSIEILQKLYSQTGRYEFVFHSYGKERHLSESALLNAMRKMGYSGDDMTGHGYRAMAKTIMLERLKMEESYIELQLGHVVRDPNGGAYHRAKFLDDRRLMMQKWADYLDELKKQT